MAMQPPPASPGCGAEMRRAADRRSSYLRTLFAASVTPLLLHLAVGRSERAAATFSLKLAARGRIRKIALRPTKEMAFLWSLGPSGARVLYRSIWVRIKAACRRLAAK